MDVYLAVRIQWLLENKCSPRAWHPSWQRYRWQKGENSSPGCGLQAAAGAEQGLGAPDGCNRAVLQGQGLARLQQHNIDFF